MKKFNLSGIQQLGRALMLPIAVLPAAALLLRFGQPDMLNLPFMASAGAAIFGNLGILFAIGIAVGFAKENNGAAGLAGVVGYFVIIKGAATLLSIPEDRAADAAAFLASQADRMSIPVGILSGITAGLLYNRYHAIKLPDYLAFFGGRRFVPIVTGFICLLWALIFGLGWPVLSAGLDSFSLMLSLAGKVGLFFYGILNRLLIVTGLHHILNNVVWFLHGTFNGVTGDLNRFFNGDPSAGAYMAGFFPVFMFGLPAACLAMYRNASPGRRTAVGGMLLSMALTAFLTGITEPIEFAFMFLAPVLYAIHAILTGLSLVIMDLLNVKLGFGFSAGFIDYVINFGLSTNPLYLLPVGAAYFVVYYFLFDFVIRKFDLKTIGRDEEPALAIAGAPVSAAKEAKTPVAPAAPEASKAAAKPAAGLDAIEADEKIKSMIMALGGPENLKSVDSCATRLRLQVHDNSASIDEAELKKLGALGFVRPDSGTLQVVLGPTADTVHTEISKALKAWEEKQSG